MNGRSQDSARPFRERLDDVLRTHDPETVRTFLVSEGQWGEDDSGDTELAMWMMIAGSPGLTALHPEAQQWLRAHGHEVEADLIAGSRGHAGQRAEGKHRHGHRSDHASSGRAGTRQGSPQHGHDRRKPGR